ncbi:MAG: phage tail protein [Pseudomonadota bacterium]
MGDSEPLAILLQTMEEMHAPSEDIIADVARFFSAYEAPERFLPLLLSWLDLSRLVAHDEGPQPRKDALPPGRLRNLISNAAELSQWRGTERALLRFLEMATGCAPFAVIPDANRPFHISIQVPGAALEQIPMIQRIVESEKPAYVTYEIKPSSNTGES